jgi:hypothetical protein
MCVPHPQLLLLGSTGLLFVPAVNVALMKCAGARVIEASSCQLIKVAVICGLR